jgi:SNF2 family DNA or RNA helicase
MIFEKDNMLCVIDCYNDKDKLKNIGSAWIPDIKAWVLPFTYTNYNLLLKTLTNLSIETTLEEKLVAAKEKEERLNKITLLSKENKEVNLKIPGIKKELLNYQKLGVMFALTNNDGMLLGDSMGLGKTATSLAVACYKKYKEGIKNCLIVVPAAVKWNWALEIEKFTNEPYVIIDGAPEDRIKQWLGQQVCRKNKRCDYTYSNGIPFFYVTNFELITEDLFGGRKMQVKTDDNLETASRKIKISNNATKRASLLKPIREKKWNCFLIDESHGLKSHHSKRSKNIKQLKANFRMALTGTPMDGRLEELHSIMEFVKPGLLEPKTRFLQKHAILDYWGKITGYKKIEEVKEKIKPYFLRRLKEQVLKDLPEKTYKDIYIEFTKKEKDIYKKIAKKEHVITEDAEAMVKVIRCKQFCDHPELVEIDDCPSSKMDTFLDTLEELIKFNCQKVIVFTQYKKMLDIIQKEIMKKKYKFLRIDGDTAPSLRASMQDKFNLDPKIDLIIGTEAMSTGLNFTGGTYCINYDDNWSPAIMKQREDRAHRLGQKFNVTVINFICKDTIEERIREVLEGKEKITAEVLGDEVSEQKIVKSLSPKELLNLL